MSGTKHQKHTPTESANLFLSLIGKTVEDLPPDFTFTERAKKSTKKDKAKFVALMNSLV